MYYCLTALAEALGSVCSQPFVACWIYCKNMIISVWAMSPQGLSCFYLVFRVVLFCCIINELFIIFLNLTFLSDVLYFLFLHKIVWHQCQVIVLIHLNNCAAEFIDHFTIVTLYLEKRRDRQQRGFSVCHVLCRWGYWLWLVHCLLWINWRRWWRESQI